MSMFYEIVFPPLSKTKLNKQPLTTQFILQDVERIQNKLIYKINS